MISDIDIRERHTILGGHQFSEAGAYEKLSGFVHFEFDPANPANKHIVDLDKAPVNTRGRVEAKANIYVLQAVEPQHRADVAIMEVVNRGNKTLFNKLNRWTPSAEHVAKTQSGGKRGGIPLEVGTMPPDPDSLELFGDGWLMRRGFTIIWVGWEADILPDARYMYLQAPTAPGVTGLVRNLALIADGSTMIPLGLWGHRPYVPLNPQDPALQ
ncbi:MAG: hypothetical protein AAGF35_12225, partial [Pseudomonadota bacterium]